MTTQTERTEVPADVARSWLLVNGARPELFDPARASRADQIILDIEDAVDPSNKDQAREWVAEWLEAGNRAWVRINDRNSDFWAHDIERLRKIETLQGIMLAKTESSSHVEDTYFGIGQSRPIIALVESALGIEDARYIACARGVFRLAFGSGDYRRDTGTAADNMAMAYPRSRLVTASRVGNLPGPIDGPTVGASHPILREQSEHSVVLGLTGKLALAIDQCIVINDTICPTNSDVIWAREFMADFEARGRVIRDGSDLPRLGRAQKIAKLAEAFGIDPR